MLRTSAKLNACFSKFTNKRVGTSTTIFKNTSRTNYTEQKIQTLLILQLESTQSRHPLEEGWGTLENFSSVWALASEDF